MYDSGARKAALCGCETTKGVRWMATPYLHFTGNCEEALALYAKAFGGTIEGISRYTEETGGAQLEGQVMHATVSLGKHGCISGADYAEPVQHGNSMQLLVHCQSMREAEQIMETLSAGGEIINRLTPHPPPDDAGMGALLRDAYGYVWIVTAPNELKPA